MVWKASTDTETHHPAAPMLHIVCLLWCTTNKKAMEFICGKAAICFEVWNDFYCFIYQLNTTLNETRSLHIVEHHHLSNRAVIHQRTLLIGKNDLGPFDFGSAGLGGGSR